MNLKPLWDTVMALALLGPTGPARAEVTERKVAEQYGISDLPRMIMEDRKLIEKYAKEAGITDLQVSWSKFTVILIGLFVENLIFRVIERRTVRRWGMQN